MGERKGQNKYYPPDFNYKVHKNLNHYHGTHALRERAAKMKDGILIIRFEMPFNIWCLGCNNHVGMGVRYNAEKKKCGMYYSSPLFEFRMKCHLCDNFFVIRTDPKNRDYELVEGCRRQEKRWDPEENGQLPGYERTKAGSAMSHKLAADAMFKREHGEKDKAKADSAESSLNAIEWIQERMRDDYAANAHLRACFRKEKAALAEQRTRDEALKACGLSIPLLPEREDDRRIAGIVLKQSQVKTFDETKEAARDAVYERRIFTNDRPSSSSSVASSVDRLRDSVQKATNKLINDKFGKTAHTEKLDMSSLGIRKKIKNEPKDDDVIEVKMDDGFVVKEEAEKEAFSIKEESLDQKPEVFQSSSGPLVDYEDSSDSGCE